MVKQFGNVAGLVFGMQTNDIQLVGRSVEDELATPVRSALIPKYNMARKAAFEAGAAGFNISGSGPAMFAICDGQVVAKKVINALKEVYRDDTEANFYLTQADKLGTRIVS